MRQVEIITDEPSQNMIIRLESGRNLIFSLWYSYNQSGWFYSLTFGSVTINNRRMVSSLNMLRQFRNVLPFGMACDVVDKQDPVFIDDFFNGRAKFYTLNPDDVLRVESLIGSV